MQGSVPEFIIDGHESGRLNVKVYTRQHNATDYWDGNWLLSSIEIESGGFTGNFGASLRSEELKLFRDHIVKIYSQEITVASFQTMEEQLRIRIEGDKLGHFTADCDVMDKVGI